MSKYIVGGGIAGLIASFYNPDFQVITDKIGGQMAMNYAGPRILEANQYSEAFLKDLGLTELKTKVATIGYKVKGRVQNTITEDLRRKYYIKSRCLKDTTAVPSSIMSDGKNTIEYFDIDWNDIISRLISKIKNPIIGKVGFIETQNKSIGIDTEEGSKILNYERLVSTIPAPIFFNLSNLKPEESLKYVQKVFVISSEYFIDTSGFDYVYFPDEKYEFHRISKVGDGKVAVEFTTNKNYKMILSKWANKSIQHFVIPVGQIQSGKVQEINGISFLGRYACWDHDIKTDDIIKICKEGVIYSG